MKGVLAGTVTKKLQDVLEAAFCEEGVEDDNYIPDEAPLLASNARLLLQLLQLSIQKLGFVHFLMQLCITPLPVKLSLLHTCMLVWIPDSLPAINPVSK